MATRYAELALKIVPLGSRPTVIDLREQIAAAVEAEVTSAQEAQRRNSLADEVRVLEASIRQRAANLAATEKQAGASIGSARSALESERAAFRRIVAGHCDLLKAIEAWLEWCDGGGDIDEQNARWQAVKATWTRYRSLKA